MSRREDRIGKLRTLELIDGKAQIKASNDLF